MIRQSRPSALAAPSDEGWVEWGYEISPALPEVNAEEPSPPLKLSQTRWMTVYRERVETGEIEIFLPPLSGKS
jgi:hypothetical protein